MVRPAMSEPNASEIPPPEATTPSVVEAMLERPISDVVRFVLQCVRLWPLALVAPWRVGRAARSGSADLPPPFAWLVLMLFAAGVSLRLFFAIEATPGEIELSLTHELGRAIGEVSLMNAVLLTLPCVLLCAVLSRLASRLLGAAPRIADDGVMRCACYALGWQAGLVAIGFATPIAMELGGMEPTGRWNGVFNQGLVVLITLGGVWGGLLLGPAVAQRLRTVTRMAVPVGSVVAAATTLPLAITCLWVLGQSANLSDAAAIADARQQRAWFGELDVDVLRVERGPRVAKRPSLIVTVAYTSRSDRLLIAPRIEKFISTADAAPLAIVDSSLDYLPDRAILIEPHATRVAEYTVESAGPLLSAAEASKPGNVAFELPFYRRETDGGFVEGRAELYLPRGELVASFGAAGQLR